MSKKLIFILLAALVALMPIGSAWAQGGVGPEPTRQPEPINPAQSESSHPLSPPDLSGCTTREVTGVDRVTQATVKGIVFLCKTIPGIKKLESQFSLLSSNAVQYAPPPSYTCDYNQNMLALWGVTDDGNQFDFDASYYNRSTGTFGVASYGPFSRQQGYTIIGTGSPKQTNWRFYAHHIYYNGSGVGPTSPPWTSCSN
jgi:hypothetical protein